MQKLNGRAIDEIDSVTTCTLFRLRHSSLSASFVNFIHLELTPSGPLSYFMHLGARIFTRLGLWATLLAVCCLARVGWADLWVTAYYAGWNQSYLAPSNIDFGAVSHVIHFSVVPNSNGSLDTTINGLT